MSSDAVEVTSRCATARPEVRRAVDAALRRTEAAEAEEVDRQTPASNSDQHTLSSPSASTRTPALRPHLARGECAQQPPALAATPVWAMWMCRVQR